MQVEVDWSSIEGVVQKLKHRDRETDTDAMFSRLEDHVDNAKFLYNSGTPEQEIWKGSSREEGIPIELSLLVLTVLEFCADHNINLTEALELVA